MDIRDLTAVGKTPRECRGYVGFFKGRQKKGHNTVVASFCFPLLSRVTDWLSKITVDLSHTVSFLCLHCGGNAELEAGLGVYRVLQGLVMFGSHN